METKNIAGKVEGKRTREGYGKRNNEEVCVLRRQLKIDAVITAGQLQF